MTFDSFISDNFVEGVIVLKDGAVVVEDYANGQSPDTRHILFSATKSVVGLLMEILFQEGAIDQDRTIGSYVPELESSAYGDATVRQAMDMEASLVFSEEYDDPRSEIAQYKYAAAMGKPPDDIVARPSLYDFLPDLRKDKQHGQVFQYSSATTEVLGWVMTRVTGRGLYDLFEEKIYRHINARRDSYFLLDRRGKALAGAGLNMTLRDMARIALLVQNDGLVGGRQVIPQAVFTALKRGGDISHFPNKDGVQWSYRSQWYFDAADNSMRALGVHGQAIYINIDNGVVIVIQSSWPSASYPGAGFRRYLFHAGISAALGAVE
jgi:CubicO group peptidase (beta-lactamase class C family)